MLFLFIMQALMETLTWPVAMPLFRTCTKYVTMGERSFQKRRASSFFKRLRCFGLMLHIGVGTTLFETEALHFPPPRVDSSIADTSRVDIRNADGSAVDFVDFTKEFKYLGSIIYS
jgi:hypothetical protein